MNVNIILLTMMPILSGIALAFYAYTHKTEKLYAFAGGTTVISLIVIALFFANTYSKTADTEIINGAVQSKQSDRVSCRHSYKCRCRQVRSCFGSGKNRSCSYHEECDTCYEHGFDVDWKLNTTLGGIYINTTDRQGLREPPRWSIAAAGDPVAQTHSYVNYVKAVERSIFNDMRNEPPEVVAKVPAYPINVYDYHYVDRVVLAGVNVPDVKQWNYDLANVNKVVGPAKQANVILIITNQNPEFYYAVRQAWNNAKKNDIVVMIGVDAGFNKQWVRVWSWSDKTIIHATLRDDLMAQPTMDRAVIMGAISNDVLKLFVRKRMREFKYLESEIEPSSTMMTFLWIVALVGPLSIIGFGVYYSRRKQSRRSYY